MELLGDKSVLVPFLLALFYYIVQRAGGVDVFSAFPAPIFVDVRIPNPSLLAAVSVGGVKVLGNLVGVGLVEFVGRKTLIAVSSTGMSFGAALFSAYFFRIEPSERSGNWTTSGSGIWSMELPEGSGCGNWTAPMEPPILNICPLL
jgi:hypothetical protein